MTEGKNNNYMYGDLSVEKFLSDEDRQLRLACRADMVTQLIPYFQGDNVQGLIAYATELERFITDETV